MKRILFPALAFLFLLPLAACGTTEPEETSLSAASFSTPSPTATETAFSMVGDDTEHLSLESKFTELSSAEEMQSFGKVKHAVFGGAIVEMPLSTLTDTPREAVGDGPSVICVFDEGTKELVPLCFNPGCRHEEDACFARSLNTDTLSYAGILDGSVFAVGKSGEEGRPCIAADFYSFGGVKRDRTVFFTDVLVRPDGSFVSSPNIAEGFVRRGAKVYFVIHDTSDQSRERSEPNPLFTRWIICFDIEAREFSYIGSYNIPSAEDPRNTVTAEFAECTDTHLSVIYRQTLYVFNLSSGQHSAVDLAAAAEAAGASDASPRASFPSENLICFSRDKSLIWYDTELEEIASPPFETELKAQSYASFLHSGSRCYLKYTDGSSISICDAGGNYFADISPVVQSMSLGSLYCETEKGLIFICYELDENGEEKPLTYTTAENGKETEYRIPEKYAYVTKDDFIDGTIDEPLFYDPETGMFAIRPN